VKKKVFQQYGIPKNERRQTFVHLPFFVYAPNYCSQVAPQQSLLPFHLAKQISNTFKPKNQLFLTTLPLMNDIQFSRKIPPLFGVPLQL